MYTFLVIASSLKKVLLCLQLIIVVLYFDGQEQRMSETIRVKVKLNASGKKLVIRKADSDDEGRYFCKVSNSHGFKETSGNLALISKYQWRFYIGVRRG